MSAYVTSALASTQQYLSGFRVPDLQKLWYGTSDENDSKVQDEPGLLIKFEKYLVKLQELSLWTDPKASLVALGIIHLIYWYLLVTSNTPVYLLSMLGLISFIYTTWTQRIWPEIRVQDEHESKMQDQDWTPVSQDVLSAPELAQLCLECKLKMSQGLAWAQDLRKAKPGTFCGLFSAGFLVLAYLGSHLTTLGLFYYISVGYLTLPGALKILVKHPAVSCMLQTYKEQKANDQIDQGLVEKNKAAAAEETSLVSSSMVTSLYAKMASGLEAVSNLNLKAEFEAGQSVDEGLESLLPEEDDEMNQAILESAMNSSVRDPMQAHNLDQDEVADSSLEYASLLPVAGNLMPDDEEEEEEDEDELDAALPQSTLKEDVEEDEFLPSEAKPLTKLEDEEEDEFTVSLMAAAAKDAEEDKAENPNPSVISRRKSSLESDENLDDFEMISEEELAQVSP